MDEKNTVTIGGEEVDQETLANLSDNKGDSNGVPEKLSDFLGKGGAAE